MNKKAEAFQGFLTEKKIEAFQFEEIKGDQQKTVVFRSHVLVEGQQLPAIVLLDESVFAMIRIQVAPNAATKDNELKLLKDMNEQNMLYKPFKLYLDQDGGLILDACLLFPKDDYSMLGDEIYGMFDVMINFLSGQYRSMMKNVWGEKGAPKDAAKTTKTTATKTAAKKAPAKKTTTRKKAPAKK